ncbi:hypothetical protein FQA39_LY03625 [Lamprigera yunnana]|nr:hypothetical protein FQA39_LY03625 [Lamprigera yunnana]
MVLKNYEIVLSILFTRWCLLHGFALITGENEVFEFSQTNEIFEPGQSWTYDYQTTVLLNQIDGDGKDVGFLIHGSLVVKSLWRTSNLDRLLQFELLNPRLSVRSGKTADVNGFMSHDSKLDSYMNSKFLLYWSNGRIQKILLRKDEPLALINLKKGIAGLFQFQVAEKEANEIDASGHCLVKYYPIGGRLRKKKISCTSPDLPYHTNVDALLNTQVQSEAMVDYELDKENTHLKSVHLLETHTMFMKLKENVGNSIQTRQSLSLTKTSEVDVVEAPNFDDAVDKLYSKEWLFTEESLLTEHELTNTNEATSFQNSVKSYRNYLKTGTMGSLSSAKVIAKLVAIGKGSTKEDIAKTIGSKKNAAVLSQLYDLLGIIQTDASHQAAMKKLSLDDKKHVDLSERYLWSLSVSPQSNPEVIKDLLKRYKNLANLPEKVKETLVLTIASMTYKLSLLPNFHKYLKVHDNVEEMIVNGLDYAKGEERYIFLRALKNLKSNSTIPKLLEILKNGTDKECVLVWKVITSLHPSQWNSEILDTAIRTFFQMDRQHDSSSRTLALDVILESKPSDDLLERLVYFLISTCKSFEVQQYLMQKLNMIGEINVEFKNKVESILRSDGKLNNYAVLAQKGLSTTLKRTFLESRDKNGTLVAIQEINGGIVKRGIVDVILEGEEVSQELFRLGIFTGGLSSFISSDTDTTDADETATAGIELTVLGTQIRPFVFFTGQGELMGHVWSGTASEMTPAYQALLLPFDHKQYIRLGSGFLCEIDLKGSASFDLSGKVEMSLWNRNGVSLIEKSAGVLAIGYIRVEAPFVKSQTQFTVSMEPKFSLQTDLDFSSGISLCMRLSQPDFVYSHNVYKTEKVPGSKHQLRRSRFIKRTLPGKTYSLNRKNNEMCNLLFKD